MECQTFKPANVNVERQLEQCATFVGLDSRSVLTQTLRQMEAEQNRRKQLLDTQAAINVAERMMQRTILNSEGELQAKINAVRPYFVRHLNDGF